jgi:hypothetical protein
MLPSRPREEQANEAQQHTMRCSFGADREACNTASGVDMNVGGVCVEDTE